MFLVGIPLYSEGVCELVPLKLWSIKALRDKQEERNILHALGNDLLPWNTPIATGSHLGLQPRPQWFVPFDCH